MAFNIRRNHIWGVVLSLLILLLILSLPDTIFNSEEDPLIEKISSTALIVNDIDKSAELYTRGFGFKKKKDTILSSTPLTKIFGGKGVRVATFSIKGGEITLLQNLNSQKTLNNQTRPILGFEVTNVSLAEEKLRSIDPNLQMKSLSFTRAAGDTSDRLLFVRDQDGNLFQFLEKPELSKQHSLQFKMDKTSLIVNDLDSNLHFYHNLLELKVIERGVYQGIFPIHNSWIEEKFETIKLSAPKGPDIELIKPVSPLYFPKVDPDHLWVLKLVSPKIYSLKNNLKRDNKRLEILNIKSSAVNYKQAMMVKDPNQYGLLIIKD